MKMFKNQKKEEEKAWEKLEKMGLKRGPNGEFDINSFLKKQPTAAKPAKSPVDNDEESEEEKIEL